MIDGCPAGLEIAEEEINEELGLRRPGTTPFVSARKEEDKAEILSGVFEGKTTGAPLSIILFNKDAQSSTYEPLKDILRPGHAHFTYLEKYGVFDYRGGGRASARETACRVAAGAVARKFLKVYQIEVCAYVKQIGDISAEAIPATELREKTRQSPLFCPDHAAGALMMQKLQEVQAEGDSLGGIVEAVVFSLPIGLGDPVYEKLEANLACALLSLPASKGVEIGAGFKAATMKGSLHNDSFTQGPDGTVMTKTNHAGGTLGGISTGMPLVVRVAFKPASSIAKPQETLTVEGKPCTLSMPHTSRHDPCVAIRASVVVEAMCALVIADALLLNRCAKL